MLRLLLLLPILLLIVVFALSNQAPVQLGLWPTGLLWTAPTSVAVLSIGALCFILGAGVTWAGRIAATARAKQAEQTVAQLRAKLAERTSAAPVAARTPGTSVALSR